MTLVVRKWVVVGSWCLAGSAAWAQAPAALPGAPAATVTPAAAATTLSETPATLPALQRPNEVKESYKAYLYQRYAHDKEAKAAIHLFARKQTGGGLWLGTGAVAIAFVASQTGTKTTSSGTTTVNVTPLGYGILVGLFGGVGVGKLLRFSNDKLFETLLEYDQRGHLPNHVVNRLRTRDYK